jgi:hypothetical protein
MVRGEIEFAQKEKIAASAFEFQMLHGVRSDRSGEVSGRTRPVKSKKSLSFINNKFM